MELIKDYVQRHPNIDDGRIYIGGEYRSVGMYNREKYLYVGKCDYPLKENESVIESHGNKYIVKRRETFYVKDTPVYEWAILVPCGEEAEDEYDIISEPR